MIDRSPVRQIIKLLLLFILSSFYNGYAMAAPFHSGSSPNRTPLSAAADRWKRDLAPECVFGRRDDLTEAEVVPKLPSLEEAKTKVAPPAKDKLLLYTGGTRLSALKYAKANNLVTVFDPTVDLHGWFSGDAGPYHEFEEQEDSENAWQPGVEDWKFFGIMSQAVVEQARGEITLAVPADFRETRNSIWHCFEFPALKQIEGVSIYTVALEVAQEGSDDEADDGTEPDLDSLPGNATPVNNERKKIWPCD
ncbi:MAG: hypothetical protein M1825_006340 [Sarcosagium campestre]|nr:MAG: hypothetical protein M1825_006340 [Sarcosagium campestre]